MVEFQVRDDISPKIIGNQWNKWMVPYNSNGQNYTIYWNNLSDTLKDNLKVCCLCQDETLLGLIAGCVYTDYNGEKIGHILHIYVDKETRKLSQFKLLVHELQKFFQEKHCTSILIELGTDLGESFKLDGLLIKNGYENTIKVYKRRGNIIW